MAHFRDQNLASGLKLKATQEPNMDAQTSPFSDSISQDTKDFGRVILGGGFAGVTRTTADQQKIRR